MKLLISTATMCVLAATAQVTNAETIECELVSAKNPNGDRIAPNAKMFVSGNAVILEEFSRSQTFNCYDGQRVEFGALVDCVGTDPEFPMRRNELRVPNLQIGSPVVVLGYSVEQIIRQKNDIRPFMSIGVYTIASCR